MKIFFILLLLLVAFIGGVVLSPLVASTRWGELNLRTIAEFVDHWANRYQTFLGVIVAVIVAYLTITAMGKQNAISERQFLSGQLQSLISDRGNLQFVSSQLNELKSQRQIFENNVAFLETEGDKSVGWQNGGNLIRTAYGNIEVFRSLVSTNTARFLGATAVRSDLIAKLDQIIGSQDRMRDAFLNWANLNRLANADFNSSPTPQKLAFMEIKGSVVRLFDDVAPSASAAVVELNKKIDLVEKDMAGLQAAIDAKSHE